MPTHGKKGLTSAEGVVINLANFGTVRWTAYLRPPANKEGRRERNMVVVIARAETRYEGQIPVYQTQLRCSGSTVPGERPGRDERSRKRRIPHH